MVCPAIRIKVPCCFESLWELQVASFALLPQLSSLQLMDLVTLCYQKEAYTHQQNLKKKKQTIKLI